MPHITQLATVTVPVADQDHAIDFYVGTLGFETRLDFTYETGERWVEVVPPGAGTSLNLVVSEQPGIETRVILITADVEGDRAEFQRAGVEVGEVLPLGSVTYWAGAPLAGNPPMFLIKDPDGNSILIVAAS
jgi:catechol 2,3-dioxygenase-like lactoylglutathione lyase family enzyme